MVDPVWETRLLSFPLGSGRESWVVLLSPRIFYFFPKKKERFHPEML